MIAHLKVSTRDEMLMYAKVMGFICDWREVGFWQRWAARWRMRKYNGAAKTMLRFFSIERVAEHYDFVRDCANEGKDERCFVLKDLCEVSISWTGEGISRLQILEDNKISFPREKQTLTLPVDEGEAALVFYCVESKSCLTLSQVIGIISWFSQKKERCDDWRYYSENY